MAKDINLERLLSTALVASMVPRDMFIEQVSCKLEQSGESLEDFSQSLQELTRNVDARVLIDRLINTPQEQDQTELCGKIDSLKESIDALNKNIEKLISKE